MENRNQVMKTFIGLCLSLFLSLGSPAQQIIFRNYTVADGLPSSTVWAIQQDKEGFIWFGTKNGLSRFDGYNFKNFQFSKAAPGSIGNNVVHCILRYDSTYLWIGTQKGISILNLQTETFTALPSLASDVFDMLKDRSGKIWIATRLDGLFRHDPLTGKTEQFTASQKTSSVSTNQTHKLAEDTEGNIWIGTLGAGLNIYHPQQKVFERIRQGEKGLPSDFINCLYKGIDGTMWIGTMNGGLCRWQKDACAFTTYQAGGEGSLKDNIVRAICQTAPGKLYVGTEKGLNMLDIAASTFTAYTHQSNDPFSISDNAVYAIYPDRQGTVWVGSFFGGVSTFQPFGSVFELYYPKGDAASLTGKAVSCFLEESPGKFWVGTEDGGLHFFDAENKTFQHYPFRPSQQKLSYHNIHSLLRDRKGRIWIGIFAGGVNVLDQVTGSVTVYNHQPANPHSLNSNLIFSLYEDLDGVIWVGTDKGLNRYDEATNSFQSIAQAGIENNIIYDVYEDNNKTLWIATYNYGLVSYNKKTGVWNRKTADDKDQPLSSDKLTSLLDDHNGNLWIGTDGGGLNKYSFAGKTVAVYNEAKGLTANVVYGIQQDDNGYIWLSTNAGIFSLQPQTGKLKHFTAQDNLQGRQFNYKAFYKASDGKLLAGGIRGFNAFSPEKVLGAFTTANIVFTNFQLFNKDVTPGEEGSPLQNQLNYNRQLTLTYDQSVMSFEFAALNFAAPDKILYAYKMEGFDKDWNKVGGQRKATYTNLAPGSYLFKVKAATSDSEWDVPEATLSVIIKPPFYQTVWAYLVYALLAAGMAYTLYRYSVERIRKQNEMRLERMKNKEEQEFYARKIEFFTVMAHEIRTPLSLIMAPLEKLLSLKKWEKEEGEQLKIMDENAERLMDLVNQLLDFRRIESDAYTIAKENIEIVSLAQAVYSRFRAMPYQKAIEFTLSTSVSKLHMPADPEVLDKILSNLLINAFKFARHKVQLVLEETIDASSGEKALAISVEDDGIGIPGSDIKNIFTKFFTVSHGVHQYHNLGGTGIGLTLASSLAEKHGGRLLVKSEQGMKTVFTLKLPLVAAEALTPETVNEAQQTENTGLPVVMIVEDEAAIQNFVASNLLSEAYRVAKAANGKEALRFMESEEVDLIISDVMMPEMDGYELCRCIKSNVQFSHLPVILLTARGNKEAEIEGVQAGADAYITKPFKWKHLMAVTKNLLDIRSQLREKFSHQPASEPGVVATNVRDKEFMEGVVGIIRNRLIDTQLSVEELSKELAMSRSSLHKKLKSLTGIGPNELIRLVRLKEAARLLSRGENTMAEVAYLTGFGSPSYFSKCFQQQFGMTPKEYASQQKDRAQHAVEDYLQGCDPTA